MPVVGTVVRSAKGELTLAVAFIIEEKESLVFADWAAERGAEIVFPLSALAAAKGVVRPAIGVKNWVKDKIKPRAVELVGAGFEGEVDDATTLSPYSAE